MKASKFFFIALVLLNSRAFAQSQSQSQSQSQEGTCTTKDFNAELGEPYQQGDTAWCSAHSAAACLSQAVHIRVSPGALAALAITATADELNQVSSAELKAYIDEKNLKDKIIYPDELDHLTSKQAFQFTIQNDEDGEPHLQHHGFMDLGGREDMAIIEANLNGICTMEQMPDGDTQYISYLNELRTIYQQYANDKTPNTWTGNCHTRLEANSQHENKTPLDHVRTVIREWVKTHCQNMQKLNTPIIPKLLALVDDKGMATQIHFQRVSKDLAYRRLSQYFLFTEIDGNFERNRVSAIGYDFCEHGAVNRSTGECATTTKNGHPGNPHQEHSGVISARKMINGQCRYFLRNHYGKTCQIYKSHFIREGLCDSNYGGIWVTRDQLQTIYSVFSVK